MSNDFKENYLRQEKHGVGLHVAACRKSYLSEKRETETNLC